VTPRNAPAIVLRTITAATPPEPHSQVDRSRSAHFPADRLSMLDAELHRF